VAEALLCTVAVLIVLAMAGGGAVWHNQTRRKGDR